MSVGYLMKTLNRHRRVSITAIMNFLVLEFEFKQVIK